MRIIPAKGYALVHEEKLPEQTEAGILMTDKDRDTGVWGEILEVTNEDDTNWKRGDRIIYSRYMTQDTFVVDENGQQMKDIWFLPVHGIFAKRDYEEKD